MQIQPHYKRVMLMDSIIKYIEMHLEYILKNLYVDKAHRNTIKQVTEIVIARRKNDEINEILELILTLRTVVERCEKHNEQRRITQKALETALETALPKTKKMIEDAIIYECWETIISVQDNPVFVMIYDMYLNLKNDIIDNNTSRYESNYDTNYSDYEYYISED
jgi:hypothetical protein